MQSNNLLKLQQFCADFITKSPDKIFKSPYFTSLSEKYIAQIIKDDDLQMKEVEIWENGVLHKIQLLFKILVLGQMNDGKYLTTLFTVY